LQKGQTVRLIWRTKYPEEGFDEAIEKNT